MKKIVICGSKGKCGKEVYRLLKQEGYQILDCVNEHEQSLQEVIAKHQSIDWVIDFTNKEVAYKHLLLCIQYHLPFICGTTGFSNQELKYIQMACQKINLKGIICSNFSLPMNILIKNFSSLSQNFDHIKIIEQHHYSKKDKPSGTGKLLKSLARCECEIVSEDRMDEIIEYDIQFESKYDKMKIVYEVDHKQVYAKGVLHYLQHDDESVFINLIQK